MSTNRIKQLRIEKGLTLGQLAEKVGLSESHLSRVEAGARGVKLSKLGALAKVLGVPMIELMPQESFEYAPILPLTFRRKAPRWRRRSPHQASACFACYRVF